jgi:hypothetical protein
MFHRKFDEFSNRYSAEHHCRLTPIAIQSLRRDADQICRPTLWNGISQQSEIVEPAKVAQLVGPNSYRLASPGLEAPDSGDAPRTHLRLYKGINVRAYSRFHVLRPRHYSDLHRSIFALDITAEKRVCLTRHPFAPVLVADPLSVFAMEHLFSATDLASLVPCWMPFPLFWAYLLGAALLAAAFRLRQETACGLVCLIPRFAIFYFSL